MSVTLADFTRDYNEKDELNDEKICCYGNMNYAWCHFK